MMKEIIVLKKVEKKKEVEDSAWRKPHRSYQHCEEIQHRLLVQEDGQLRHHLVEAVQLGLFVVEMFSLGFIWVSCPT